MPFREIILTQRLLTLKMKKLQKLHRDITIRAKPERQKSFMFLLNQSIENNAVFCKGCGKPIDKTFVGKPIIINRNTTSYIRKWYHVECSKRLNIIYTDLQGESRNVSN